MVYVITGAKRFHDELRAASSFAQIAYRPIFDGRIGNSYVDTEEGRMPLVWSGIVPHTIVSKPLQAVDEAKLPGKIRAMKEWYIQRIALLVETAQMELANAREGTKKHENLEDKVGLGQLALGNAETAFVATPGMETIDGIYYQLTMPPVMPDNQLLNIGSFFELKSPYNSPARTLHRFLRMPYSIIDFDEQKRIVVTDLKPSVDMILESRIMGVDAETENYLDISLAELKGSEKEVLATRYAQIKGNGREEEIERAMKFPKRKLIKELEDYANETKEEALTLLALNSDGKNYLVSRFSNSRNSYTINDPVTGKMFIVPVIIEEDSRGIGATSAGIITDYDPLIIAGQNHTCFDLSTIRKLSKNSFPIGVDGTNPISSHSIPGSHIKVYDAFGRDFIDPALYFMFHGDTRQNTLDEIARFQHGVIDEKTMSHIELAIKTDRAFSGNQEDTDAISEYGWSDSQKALHNVSSLIREVYAAALLYRTRMINVSTTSPKGLSLSFWGDDLTQRGAFPYFDTTFHSFNLDRMSKDSTYLFNGMISEGRSSKGQVSYKEFNREQMLERILKKIAEEKKTKLRGMQDAVLVEFHPYMRALLPLFERIPELKQAVDAIDSIDDLFGKARMMTHIENVLDLPLFDALSWTRYAFRRRETEINSAMESHFSHRFNPNASLREITDLVHEEYVKLYQMLKDKDIITVSGNKVLLPIQCRDAIADNGGLVLAEGTAYVASPSEFAFVSGTRMVTSGMSSPKQNKGLKSEFEKTTLKKFYEILFDKKPDEAFAYLYDRIGEVVAENIGREEHVVSKTARRDFHNISSNARGRAVEASTDQKVMAGETIRLEFDDEELQNKTTDRFRSPLIMAIGHSPDLLRSRKLREKMMSGTLNPIELEMILSSIRR